MNDPLLKTVDGADLAASQPNPVSHFRAGGVRDVGPPAKEQSPDGEIWQAAQRFIAWIEKEGYDSYDPYDIWGTKYGLLSRRIYYRHSKLGLLLIAPILAAEIAWPRLRSLFVAKNRYATADAQLALGFLNLYHLTQNSSYLTKAISLGEDLLASSCDGYSGRCWGYPFDWQHVDGLTPHGTPLITTTPYCFEVFSELFDVTGNARYLEVARSIATFVADDLKDTPAGENAMAGSYSPRDSSKVVNASAYRAYILFEAGDRFGIAEYVDKASKNLRFILQSQRSDGSWLYAIDNPGEAFIDHFHTCFVLKNLGKLNRRLQDTAVSLAIDKGFAFYRRDLFKDDGLPKSFAIEPRAQIARLEMYNVAEAITLGSLLRRQIPPAFELASALGSRLCREFQLPDGHFVTRVYTGGLRHKMPFLRWPQAQLFYALTNLLSALGGDADGAEERRAAKTDGGEQGDHELHEEKTTA